MEMLCLTKENLLEEHICCAFGDKKSQEGYENKKRWIKEQLDHGFVFRKYPVRHKVFIEYVPTEYSWYPLEGAGYYHINCFWVAGKYKGQGLGKNLLQACLQDTLGSRGVMVISSKKKRPFLGDRKFFEHHGFELCDTAPPYFELLVRKNDSAFESPRFLASARRNICYDNGGFRAYYFNGCPYTEHYVEKELREIAKEYGLPLEICRAASLEEARKTPSAFPLHSLFYKGHFLTHEILTKKRFARMWPLEDYLEKQGL